MEPNFNAEIKENLTNIPNLYKKHSLIPVTENKIITDQEFFSILKESSRKGLCGLENKSKTYCYINSTLQCMSHTIEITNSFFNYYKNTSKIDSENSSSNEKMVSEWYQLLNYLWTAKRQSISNRHIIDIIDPSSFIKSFIELYNNEFRENQQNDAGAFLNNLITSFRTAMKENKKIHDSLQLFNLESKTIFSCLNGHQYSNEENKEPLNILSLSIPSEFKKIDVYLVPAFNCRPILRVPLKVSKEMLVNDILHLINSKLKRKIKEIECVIIKESKVKCFLNLNDKIIDLAEKKGFIFVYELDPQFHNKANFRFLMKISNSEENYIPRMLTMNEEMTMRDLEIRVYGFMRRLGQMPDLLRQHFSEKYENHLEKVKIGIDKEDYSDYLEIIKNEYELLFETSNLPNDLMESIEIFKKSLPFQLSVTSKDNSIDQVLINNYYNESEVSEFNSSSTMKEIKSLFYKANQLDLKINTQNIQEEKLKPLFKSSQIKYLETDKVNIHDCLNQFSITTYDEDIQKDCVECNRKLNMKRDTLNMMPNLLIIHLKIFLGENIKHQSKLEIEIDNLCLQPGDSTPVMYNLYAVIIHKGRTIQSGHFTAMCKNNGIWYHFDDSKVEVLELTSVIDLLEGDIHEGSCPYILFYKRKL